MKTKIVLFIILSINLMGYLQKVTAQEKKLIFSEPDEVYEGLFKYISYDDNYDDFQLYTKQGKVEYSFVCNDIRDYDEKYDLKKGDWIKIRWMADTIRPAGGPTQFEIRDRVLELKKIDKKIDKSDWDEIQDSLRAEVLKLKENTILKESFLKEFYIRNIAKTSGDSVYIHLRFNLDSLYCEALDCEEPYCEPYCYTEPTCNGMDLSFGFKLDEKLTFPPIVKFKEYKHGYGYKPDCVEQEYDISGSFRLLKQTGSYVIYSSKKHKRTLVLFNSLKKPWTVACYFADGMYSSIK